MSGGSARIKADLTLLLVSVIWGSAFVAQRVAAGRADVFLFNGARFLLGALALLPLARNGLGGLGRGRAAGIALAGGLLFAAAALQQIGLQTTTAGNAGFITGLYVVLIPLILAIGGRQQLRWTIWAAVALSAVGLFLLSTGGQLRLAPGDAFELGGAFLWALHVILIGALAGRAPVALIACGQYLFCGLFNLAVAAFTAAGAFLGNLAAAAWPILYTGVFSIAIGYTLQVSGQRHAPPADAAILLSMEAVFAALAGWLILGERLAPVQLTGCGLMIGGMIIGQVGSSLKVG
jgi:drug/metabolite transporter (DMT)-like permease